MYWVDNKSSSDPYLNLALEEYLVRNIHFSDPLLLMYINTDSIVLGKNQNIWKEANILYARKNDIAIARRVTGGGTVYHDKGNINFSIITKFEQKELNRFDRLLIPVVEVLKSYGINAEINNRNDIEIDGYKISGTAQFTNRKKIISHGTLLVESNLNNLSSALKPQFKNIQSRGIDSTRSKVTNLAEVKSGIQIEELKVKIRNSFAAEETFILSEADWQKVMKLRNEKYETIAWQFEKSSDCNIEDSFIENGKEYQFLLTIEDGFAVEYTIKRGGQVIEQEKLRLHISNRTVKESCTQRFRKLWSDISERLY